MPTDPMIDRMRNVGSTTPTQSMMQMPPSDPLAGSVGSSYLSTSSSNNFHNSTRPAVPPHSAMPPPVSQQSQNSQYTANPSAQPAMQVQNRNGSCPPPSSNPPLFRNPESRPAASMRSSDPPPVVAPHRPGSGQNRSDPEWQKIRHKQQRLLLLRHASRCQHQSNCPVTPHCASMKKLWEHIAHCKDQQCTVQHCLSSRYVLSHYRRCKDPRCPACGPVRETIRKSSQREGNRQQGRSSFDNPSSMDPINTSSKRTIFQFATPAIFFTDSSCATFQ
jgi:hypothetical protein